MRVITGEAKGTRLRAPEGWDVRPTTDRVKEGIFSAIQFELTGARVLDLFAGSGQLGIEALSRGAAQAVFVDDSPAAIRVIEENLEKAGMTKRARLCQMQAQLFLKEGDAKGFDFVFLDPPYRQGILTDILPDLTDFVHHKGKIMAEHEKNYKIPEKIRGLRLQKEYNYGKIVVSVLQRTGEVEA